MCESKYPHQRLLPQAEAFEFSADNYDYVTLFLRIANFLVEDRRHVMSINLVQFDDLERVAAYVVVE